MEQDEYVFGALSGGEVGQPGAKVGPHARREGGERSSELGSEDVGGGAVDELDEHGPEREEGQVGIAGAGLEGMDDQAELVGQVVGAIIYGGEQLL